MGLVQKVPSDGKFPITIVATHVQRYPRGDLTRFITDSTAFHSKPRGAFLVIFQLLMTTLDSIRAHFSPLWHYY